MESFKKNDSGKPQMSLIAPAFKLELAKVLTKGAELYGPGNYLKGAAFRRYFDAAERHLNQWAMGEDIDNGPGGTGCHHLACAAASMMILFESQRVGVGDDNRLEIHGPDIMDMIPAMREVAKGLRGETVDSTCVEVPPNKPPDMAKNHIYDSVLGYVPEINASRTLCGIPAIGNCAAFSADGGLSMGKFLYCPQCEAKYKELSHA